MSLLTDDGQGDYRLFLTVPRGLSGVAAQEVLSLAARCGKEEVRVTELAGGVAFAADLELAYRVMIWCRSGSRLLLQLAELPANDSDILYSAARDLPWSRWLTEESTLAIRVTHRSARIGHDRYAMLRLKDAIVDECRDSCGWRPSIDLDHPKLPLQLHLDRDRALLHLDLGGPLHQRGYRSASTPAPLRENLAAAMLLRAGWPSIAAEGGALVDPMCGSGTLLIEAAWIATDTAPALLRLESTSLIEKGVWPGHRADLLDGLIAEAKQRRAAGSSHEIAIYGYDSDRDAVDASRRNLASAGVDRVVVEQRAVGELVMPEGLGELSGGLVVANPPYGERIGRGDDLPMLYRSLGRRLLEQFSGWQAAILTGHGGLGLELGIKARRSHTIWNGPVECRLLRFELDQGARMIEPVNQLPLALLRRLAAGQSLPVTAEAVANRLRKNSKHAGRLARKEGVTCYRIYDADLPEHAVAVDLYHDEDGKQWLVAQEYAPPPSIPAETARGRLVDTLHALIDVYGVGVEQLFLKRRERQRGRLQYRRFDRSGDYHAVREGKARLWVNFSDHLDTGLFLDHRITRQRLAGLAQGKRFLNLFSYTGAATVQAALGGAATTISVDLSANYLDWLRANLSLNGIDGPAHRCERADVREWLSEQPAASYDLIFLDPPTFSTSKRMEGTLDIQRDHVELIKETMRLLTADGLLLFSTNSRRFQLDEAALGPCLIADISDQTIPPDFARNRRIHQAWEMRWPEGSV